ncbi:unnamed protein product [Arabis nemorensis]|uniref:Flavin-containing monooxygenase n=1 Tax=Arabis nemorensis TaxID=586526 RepID=A0A565BFE8_9BRAS|nr:unnamed protein product [Arabis nemorensis]
MHSQIDIVREDGSIVFQNGKMVYANTIVHCTGYKYYFPFLETSGYINIDDNRIDPLYKHIFPPALAPGLSFIGLSANVLQFYMFEVQSKWVATVLSGRCEYLNWITEQCGFPHVEQWRIQEIVRGYQRLVFQPETFREEWDDDDLMKEAYEDFARQNLISFHPSRFLESKR